MYYPKVPRTSKADKYGSSMVVSTKTVELEARYSSPIDIIKSQKDAIKYVLGYMSEVSCPYGTMHKYDLDEYKNDSQAWIDAWDYFEQIASSSYMPSEACVLYFGEYSEKKYVYLDEVLAYCDTKTLEWVYNNLNNLESLYVEDDAGETVYNCFIYPEIDYDSEPNDSRYADDSGYYTEYQNMVVVDRWIVEMDYNYSNTATELLDMVADDEMTVREINKTIIFEPVNYTGD